MAPRDDEECTTWGPPPPQKKAPASSMLEEPLLDVEDPKIEYDEEAEKKSLIVSICTLALSIPALIGAWCWPALVIGLVSGTVSAAARTLGHWISFGITLALMIVVNIFMIYTLKNRYYIKNCWVRNGPLILTLVATPFIMADLTRHILNDLGAWDWCGNNMAFPRINQTYPPEFCRWSATEYACDVVCCVPADQLFAEDGPDAIVNVTGTYKYDFGGAWGEVTFPQLGGKYDDPKHCTCDDCTPTENWNHLSMMGMIFTIGFTYFGFVLLAVGVMWNARIVDKLKKIKEEWNALRGRSSLN